MIAVVAVLEQRGGGWCGGDAGRGDGACGDAGPDGGWGDGGRVDAGGGGMSYETRRMSQSTSRITRCPFCWSSFLSRYCW